jgi:thiol-disulfide isomerase/thioredoxin
MKKIFSLTLLLLFAIVAKAQVTQLSVFEQTRNFKIEGKIKGYQPGDNNKFISFRTYEITGLSKDTAISIDKNGNFSCELYQPFEGDIALIYNDVFIETYASPSEKIFMKIYEDKWKTEENKTNAISFRGKSASISKGIVDFEYYKSNQPFNNNPDGVDKKHGSENFAKKSIARMNEELNLFDNYVMKKKIKDEKHMQWCRNNIIYSTGRNIAFYCFAGEADRTITCNQLIDYLVSIPINNSGALNNSAYYGFLYTLMMDFQMIASINPIYRDSLKQKGNSAFVFGLEKIDVYSTGITKELMYYSIYKVKDVISDNEYAFNISRFDSIITEPYLKQLFMSAKSNEAGVFTPFNLVERIKKHSSGDSLSNRLATLLERHKDAYIFMDFWGSWCGTCMIEMPLYPNLIGQFKGQPIVFLFLAVETKEEKIQEVKTKYKINGEFISLNGNEAKILNNVLQFSSYPSHFMLDPTGNIVNNKIGQLSFGGDIAEQIRNTMSKK